MQTRPLHWQVQNQWVISQCLSPSFRYSLWGTCIKLCMQAGIKMQMLSFYQIRKFIVISSPFFSCKWIYTPSLVILHKKKEKKKKGTKEHE